MGIIERMHTANAVYFSIFYCGCKQLKSIHFFFGCKDSARRAKKQSYLYFSEQGRGRNPSESDLHAPPVTASPRSRCAAAYTLSGWL